MAETKERLDIMLDMETLGTQVGSIILSVAMVAFNVDVMKAPKVDFDYHQHISVLSSLFHHLRSDNSTEDWWMRQTEVARKKVLDGQREALDVDCVTRPLYKLMTEWNEKYDLYIWGHGVGSFDLPLLDDVMRKVIGEGYKTPWKFWAAMDVRSLVNFSKLCGLVFVPEDTPHDAHEDVMKQIKEVQMCWQYVKVERAM